MMLPDEDEDADPEAEWDAELARRVEEIRTGKAVGEPAEEVFAKLREKYS
jgi:putative addiction module component (TIGR02574 family)